MISMVMVCNVTDLCPIQQEFSIEIPDKEADAIHSSMFPLDICL